MDKKLSNALDFANYAHTLHKQKNLAKQKFLDECIVYFNAGKFTVTQDLITSCKVCKSKAIILLDDNCIPVEIENVNKFTKLIEQTYLKAISEYFDEYQRLGSYKDVQGLLDE